MTPKEAVLEMIRQMPDNATWEQIAEEGEAIFGDATGTAADEDPDEIAEWERRLERAESGQSHSVPAHVLMQHMKEKYG